MEAYKMHCNYIQTLEGISDEDMAKLIKEGGMASALLVDIGRSLAILADNIDSVSQKLQDIENEIHKQLLWR